MSNESLKSWINWILEIDEISSSQWLEEILSWLNDEIEKNIDEWNLQWINWSLEKMSEEIKAKVSEESYEEIGKKFEKYQSIVNEQAQKKHKEIKKTIDEWEEKLEDLEKDVEKKSTKKYKEEKATKNDKTEKKTVEDAAEKALEKPTLPTKKEWFRSKHRLKVVSWTSFSLLSTVWRWRYSGRAWKSIKETFSSLSKKFSEERDHIVWAIKNFFS